MKFCTVSDLIADLTEHTLIQLTDDNTPPTSINNDRCNTIIDQASEIIEGRLAGRIKDMSVIKNTPLLKRIALDICAYFLYSRRNKGDIENIRRRYENSIKELDHIKLSQIHPSGLASNSAEYMINKSKSSRVFSRDVLYRY